MTADETSSLIQTNNSDIAVTIAELAEPKQSYWQQFLDSDFVKGEDWWSVYVGFAMFIIAVPIITQTSILTPVFSEWTNNPFTALTSEMFVKICILGAVMTVSVLVALRIMNKKPITAASIVGFVMIMAIAVFSKLLGAQKDLHRFGLGDSVWAIFIGAILSNILFNFIEVPKWLSSVHFTEFYIKISVVLLAVDLVLFGEVGYRGVIVTWVDTPIVLGITFFIGRYLLKMTSEESVISAGGLSICGSSAATAISSSIKGEKTTAPITIAIMSLFTVPLIPLMPMFANWVGMDAKVAGAWIGGSVDSTGAVVATATLLGKESLETAAIIKMMQNIFIGPFCLLLTIIWTRKFSPKVLYDRFPKFVIGFIALSVILSTAVPATVRVLVQKNVFAVSEWFSTVGFVFIGLDLNLIKLFKEMGGKGFKFIVLYVTGQALDLLTTFGWAYLAFSVIPY
jgi:uncharacterized integral membrane protein (TIGR00698 family)